MTKDAAWMGLITTLVLGSYGWTTFTHAQEQQSDQQLQQQQQANTDAIRYLILNECMKKHPIEECLKLVPPDATPPAPPGQ